MTATIEGRIAHVLQGYAPAVQCFFLIRDVLHFWDDLIDQDRHLAQQEIHDSMFKALVLLPSNPFYAQHLQSLQPVLVNAIANWRAANAFEATGDTRQLQLAFVIRSDYANILIQMAYLVGGHDWVMSVAPSIRDMWTDEDFDSYLINLAHEKAMRSPGVTHVL